MTGHRSVPSPIVEDFTFRSGGRHITVPAIIDTGADTTIITSTVVEALRLDALGSTHVGVASGGSAPAYRFRCAVAWALYESQRYASELDVLCTDSREVLIGADFLTRHELMVDFVHRGLCGVPQSPLAEPLTGGGFVVNAPPGLVRRLNRAIVKAARPGQVLLPHPSWRFTRPAGVKGIGVSPPRETTD